MKLLSAAVLLVMICGTYASSADLEQSFLIRHKRGILSGVMNALQIVTGPIEHVTTNIINVAEDFGHALIIKKFQPTIDKVFSSLRNISERIKKYLTHTFRVLPHCLVTLHDDIKDMFVLALENIAVCVGPIVMEGLQLRDMLYQSIKNLTIQYYGEFKDCFERNHIFDISACLGEVIYNIEIKGIDLLIQSLNDLGPGIEELISIAKTYLSVCGIDLLGVGGSAVTYMVSKFVSCAVPHEH